MVLLKCKSEIIRILFLILLLSTSLVLKAQDERLFSCLLPDLDSTNLEFIQYFRIEFEDTSYNMLFKNVYTFEGNNKYLTTYSYNQDGKLDSKFKEKISPKGLKFQSGTFYEYDANGNRNDLEFHGRKAFTFPFKNIDKMIGKTVNTKYTYDNKIVRKVSNEFIGKDSISSKNGNIEVFNFIKTTESIYSKDYINEVIVSKKYYSITKGFLLRDFINEGEFNYKGILLKNF